MQDWQPMTHVGAEPSSTPKPLLSSPSTRSAPGHKHPTCKVNPRRARHLRKGCRCWALVLPTSRSFPPSCVKRLRTCSSRHFAARVRRCAVSSTLCMHGGRAPRMRLKAQGDGALEGRRRSQMQRRPEIPGSRQQLGSTWGHHGSSKASQSHARQEGTAQPQLACPTGSNWAT